MKKTNIACLALASLLFIISSTNVQAQNTDVKSAVYHQKDYIGENPTADQDLKIFADYENACVSGDSVKARSLLADDYKGYGPGPSDSTTAEQVMNWWTQNYKTQSNRKVNFVEETYRVIKGDYKGNWVAMWGEYDCTINGKDIRVPFQSTAQITNGKINFTTSYWDNWSVYQALGYTLTPPNTN